MSRSLAALAAFAVLVPAAGRPVDLADTRLVSDPASSGSLLAFAYGGDLWVAGTDGAGVRRLTSHPGVESGPRFSPDGSLIAFTGRYEGNTDVYVVPAAGGVPRRLTYHPGTDTALGFTADGRSVLFASAREVSNNRYTQLFSVPTGGGFPTRLKVPNASKAAISPDGKTIAYVPLAEQFAQWKHYRGGSTARILLFDDATHAVEAVPQPEGRCNDMDPNWVGSTVYFRSDRNGEYNVFTYSIGGTDVRQVTRFEDFPVIDIATDGKSLLLEQAGYLHALNPGESQAKRLKELELENARLKRLVAEQALANAALQEALAKRGPR